MACQVPPSPNKGAAGAAHTGSLGTKEIAVRMASSLLYYYSRRPRENQDMATTSEAISFGAGVNSTAMTIMLVKQGWHGPIVFADPGAEKPDTYRYMTMFENWLKPHGLSITQLTPQTHPDLYHPSYRMTLQEKCHQKQIVPIIFRRWCTNEYKRIPLTRWAKAHSITTQLLGITTDESRRARIRKHKGIELKYPLIDHNINHHQCKKIFKAANLPVPPKSSCWFCPFQKKTEWYALYKQHPALFRQAVEMDKAAIKKANRNVQLGWNFQMPLEKIYQAWKAQLELPEMPPYPTCQAYY